MRKNPKHRPRRGMLPHLLALHVAAALVSGAASAAGTPAEGGRSGDRLSWRTDEFAKDWGLAAINADAAYARGLTGNGVRLGVFDSGSGLDHPEFAGKDHRSLSIGDLLADGSRCTRGSLVGGEDACFATRGDQVEVTGVAFDEDVPEDIRSLIQQLRYGGKLYSFGSHGTHVAGTIAANRDGQGMHGVAFGGTLAVAKLFPDSLDLWSAGDFNYEKDILVVQPELSAFEDMYQQMAATGTRALNHSWGRPVELYDADDLDDALHDPAFAGLYEVLAEGSRRTGLIQVFSAGNTSAPIDSPGNSPFAGAYASLPRLHADLEPYWLSVVNVDQAQVLSDRSMKCGLSADWCLAAPGTDIASTVYGEDSRATVGVEYGPDEISLVVSERLPEYAYADYSGTSMAAPHVTGALGLLFERYPYLSNPQVRDVLLTTATDLGEVGVDDVYGWGLVNLERAIEGYGSLRVDTDVVMNTRAGGLKVWEGDAWDDWTNDIGGPGRLTKSGIGWLRLSGDNTFNGAVVRQGVLELDGRNALTDAVQVDGGHLLLNGRLVSTDLKVRSGSGHIARSGVLDGSSLDIEGGTVAFNGRQAGGTTHVGVAGVLQGTGRLGSTTVAGTLAPGNSIGTLTVDGDYIQTATGTYQAELAPGSQSDLLHVTGQAALDGGLQALPSPGIYYLGEHFRILQADGGVQGRFAQTDFAAFSPFLRFGVAYGDGVSIDVTRGQMLATAAVTPNQHAVAASADGLDIHQGLPRPLTQLFPAQVGAALDGLSGELHAAIPQVLVQSSGDVRDAALGHAAVRTAASAGDDGEGTAWVQSFGGTGRLEGQSNTARTTSTTRGVLFGVDRSGEDAQFGALLGMGRSDARQGQGRQAKARMRSAHGGVYAGKTWGALTVRGGLGYSRHSIDTEREVAFAGFTDHLSATYKARTRQAFIDVGHRFGDAQGSIEPYLQIAQVDVDVGRLREQGGAAALSGRIADTHTTLFTTGVRFEKKLDHVLREDASLQLVGGAGYRRAVGDLGGQANVAFDGGSTFQVQGAPNAANALVIDLGVSAWLTPRQQLELGYAGQFSGQSRDHSLNAQWSVRF